ncbi:uncharacterized protein [Mytilus edulis]|uniref:uncharacterized protein n=1 Tax=Mytilus edulis TaxID=6550 RepID=UPI0039EE64D6
MAATHNLCDICDQRHVTKSSAFWCPECEQAFCDDCNTYHGFSKLSKHHVTVSIKDHLALSSSISQISNMCMEHNEQYQMVCQAHDELLCLKCIENHDGCKGIIPTSKIIENVKKSSLFQETQHSLKDINGNIKALRSELNKQLGSIKQQEETIFAQISDTRNKINDHLDTLEKKIRNEVAEVTAKLNYDKNQTLQILESKNDSTKNAEQQIKDLEMYATDIQTYLGLRHISAGAAATESYLKSIFGDDCMTEITLIFKTDNKMDNIIDEVPAFGSIKAQKSPFQLPLVTYKNKQAQLVGSRLKSITEIKLRLRKTIKTKLLNIKGIVVLPSGNIILTDYSSGNVVVFSTDWKILNTGSFESAFPVDVTYIDNKTVVTTSSTETCKGVNIIDINTENVIKFIPTIALCYGITYHNGSLVVCASTMGIFKVDPQNGASTDIITTDLPSWSYIEMFDDKIYYTNQQTETVNCCDKNGKAIWTFKDKNILRNPHGIAVDNSGYVYIACSTLHRVVVVSPDGQQNRQLLSSDNGLESPFAMHYDRNSNCLLIANEKQTVCTYEIIN